MKNLKFNYDSTITNFNLMKFIINIFAFPNNSFAYSLKKCQTKLIWHFRGSNKFGWHGNASTRKRIKNYFWGITVFLEIRGNPLKVQNCWGISEYFVSVSQYLELKGFLFFLINFLRFLGLFPHIFDPFPLF